MRLRRGFTYGEMLVALCIIVLFSAIAFPSVMSLARRTEIARLNDEAHAVYMSAYEELVLSYFDGVLKPPEKEAPESPASLDSRERVYCTLSREDAENEDAINLISLTKENASLILEYAKASASIADVYFLEGVYLSENMSVSELEEMFLEGKLSSVEKRERQTVGYYGGDPADWGKARIKPTIILHNKEDLFLDIYWDDLPHAQLGDFKVEITLSGSGYTKKVIDSPPVDTCGDNKLHAKYPLDSMQPYGEKFALKYPELAKGEVTASVTVSCGDFSGTASVSFDPLYESRDEKDEKNIYVSCVRHLNNLRYLDEYSAVQTGDISFSDPPPDNFYDGKSHNLKIDPLPELNGSFDGGGFIIHNISLNESENGTGLFESISGCAKNIHLAGCANISASTADKIGGICGELYGEGHIYNCSVSEMNIKAPEGAFVDGIVYGNKICTYVKIKPSLSQSHRKAYFMGSFGFFSNV